MIPRSRTTIGVKLVWTVPVWTEWGLTTNLYAAIWSWSKTPNARWAFGVGWTVYTLLHTAAPPLAYLSIYLSMRNNCSHLSMIAQCVPPLPVRASQALHIGVFTHWRVHTLVCSHIGVSAHASRALHTACSGTLHPVPLLAVFGPCYYMVSSACYVRLFSLPHIRLAHVDVHPSNLSLAT